jgi:hypothetical protein
MFALAAALGVVAWDASVQIRHVRGLTERLGVVVDPPAADPAATTGYALGRRTLVLPAEGADGYQWVMQTQAMLAGEGWRIHRSESDNAPEGREVHWGSPFRWWLGLLAWVDHAISGGPRGTAVERAALLAGPVLLGLLLLGLVPLVARRFGSFAASLLAISMVSSYPFYLYFAAGYPDHHGALEACAMLTMILLLAGAGGWVRTEHASREGLSRVERGLAEWLPTPRAARGWFAASAVAGGIGLWISAASMVPMLIGLGLGVIAASWLCRDHARSEFWRSEPALWRFWGRVGCATSVVAYLVEYFPAHLGFRLEVNHPLYALAWLGGGELLCRISRMLGEGRLRCTRRDAVAGLLAAAAVALLPATILLTGKETFRVLDPFVWQLSTRYIAEGQSLATYFSRVSSGFTLLERCLPALFILPALLLLRRSDLPRIWKAQLVMTLAPALLFLLMTGREIRWWGLADGMVFVVLVSFFLVLERHGPERKYIGVWWLACALVLVPGAISAIRIVVLSADYTPQDIRQLAERDFAHWLRIRMGSDPVVVASTPVTTNQLIYHGGFKGLGTAYWENTTGLRRGAAIFAAPSSEEAQVLISRYGVTHIVVLSWDNFAEEYVRMYRELTPGSAETGPGFIPGLLHGQGVPAWLRLVPYRLPKHDALKGQSVVVLEVTPVQRPEEALVRTANYLVEMERPELASRMEPALKQAVGYYPALVTLAYVQGKSGEAGEFSATLKRVVAGLPQKANLALEDRLHLAAVLMVGGRPDLAREEVMHSLVQADERSLRRLPPGALADFSELCAGFGVQIADPELRRLAASLVPPYLRVKR